MTFDGANKRIILSSSSTSASEIWTEWVKWLDLDTTNTKWLPALKQVGGDDLGSGLLIPPYMFLLNGWRIRPMESSHLLVITGNIFVDGGGQPVVNTLGAYNVSVQYTVPVQAQGYSTTSSGGTSITADEIWNYTTRSLTASTTSSLTEEQNAKLMSLDTSSIPASVWSYVSRTLSVAAGLTPEQEAKIDSVVSKLNTTLDANIKSVQGITVSDIDDFKADVSGISVNVDPQDIWEYANRSLTQEVLAEVDLSSIPAAVWSYVSRSLSTAAGLTPAQESTLNSILSKVNETVSVDPAQIWNYSNRTLSVAAGLTALQEAKIDAIKTQTDKLRYDVQNRILSYIEDKADFSLSSADKELLASVIEAHIINETDSNAVLKAITDKISSVNPSLGDLTLNAIANSVWTSPSAINPLKIWEYSARTLTNKDSNITSVNGVNVSNIQDFRNDMSELYTRITEVPEYVWGYSDRTVNNTITIDPASIWSYGNRSLTDKDMNVKSVNGVEVSINDFKTDISSIASQVWAYGTRTTSDAKLSASEIWNYMSRTLTVNNSNIVSVNGSPVTSVADFKSTPTTIDVNAISDAVWTRTIRTFTNSITFDPSLVWNYANRSLTVKDANIISVNSTPVTSIADFKTSSVSVDLSGIPAAVWTYGMRSITDSVDIASVNGIEVNGPDDFKAALDIDLSGIPYSVWNYGNRTVNSFISAADIWSYANKSVNVVSISGQSVTKAELTALPEVNVDLSTISEAVWAHPARTFTNTLNIPSVGDIWSHSTRSLTDRSMNITSVMGTPISSIEDFKSEVSDISLIPAQVWSYLNRSLTTSISIPTAAEIWSYNTRSLTESVDVNSIKGESISKLDLSPIIDIDLSSIPSAVWGFGTRTTTDAQLSASDIWSYGSRSLTSNVQLDPDVAQRISNIPVYGDIIDSNIIQVNNTEVVLEDFRDRISYEGIWSYSTRNITGPVDLKSDLRTAILDIENYDDSTVLQKLLEVTSKIDFTSQTLQDSLDTKPSLIDIEGSTVLAKTSSVSAVEMLVRSLPGISDIVSEFKNIQYGKMEIVNNQMKVWDQTGELIVTYDLFDKNGLPTMGSVYKKVVV